MYLTRILSLATMASPTLSKPTVPIIEPAVVYRDVSSSLANTTTRLDSRAANDPGYYFCSEAHWKGDCGWQPLGQQISWTTGWSGSFGPDHGVVCKIYDDFMCATSDVGAIRYPGIADLSTDQTLRQVLVDGPHCVSCEKDYL